MITMISLLLTQVTQLVLADNEEVNSTNNWAASMQVQKHTIRSEQHMLKIFISIHHNELLADSE